VHEATASLLHPIAILWDTLLASKAKRKNRA